MDELPLLVESVHASNNAERNRQKYGRQLSLLSQIFRKSQRTMKSICCKSPAKARTSWPHLCVLSTWTSRLPPQATSSNRICFKLRVFPPLRTTSTSDQHTMRPMNKGLNTRFCRTGLGRKMSSHILQLTKNPFHKCLWPNDFAGKTKVLDLQFHVHC